VREVRLEGGDSHDWVDGTGYNATHFDVSNTVIDPNKGLAPHLRQHSCRSVRQSARAGLGMERSTGDDGSDFEGRCHPGACKTVKRCDADIAHLGAE
jgi:hypothetical protein